MVELFLRRVPNTIDISFFFWEGDWSWESGDYECHPHDLWLWPFLVCPHFDVCPKHVCYAASFSRMSSPDHALIIYYNNMWCVCRNKISTFCLGVHLLDYTQNSPKENARLWRAQKRSPQDWVPGRRPVLTEHLLWAEDCIWHIHVSFHLIFNNNPLRLVQAYTI